MKYFLVGLILTVQIFALKAFTVCKLFEDSFHLSIFDLSLRLNESINNDQGIPLVIVRIFHNKAIGIIFDLFKHYMHFWDLPFLVHVFSFSGLFGLVLGIWHITKLSTLKRIGIFITLLLVPFIEILFKPQAAYMVKITLYSVPYSAVIIYGYLNYFENITRVKIITIIILLLLSAWWILVMNAEVLKFCIKY